MYHGAPSNVAAMVTKQPENIPTQNPSSDSRLVIAVARFGLVCLV